MEEKFISDLATVIDDVRKKAPLVHNITNYVTVNDCANALLAVGASPIMADDIGEVEAIVSISSALVVNIGTLNTGTIDSMIAAGKKANSLKIPVVFDPVGAGASELRNRTVKEFLEQVQVCAVRGNLSEIAFIVGNRVSTKGVDVSVSDEEKNNPEDICRKAAQKFNCVVAVTGKTDYISDGKRTAYVENGNPLMSKVTGTGCMLSAIMGAFCAAAKDKFYAVGACVAAMGIAGEISFEENSKKGTGSFHIGIIDALSKINSEMFKEKSKVYEK